MSWTKKRFDTAEYYVRKTGFTITIHRMHGLMSLYFVSCHHAGVDQVQLKATELEAAKREGVDVVIARVTGMVKDALEAKAALP